MSTPILTTKLSIPPKRMDWVVRPRLLKRLDEGVRHRLTLISAPAGFGKSTLIASWVHKQQTCPRLAWFSVEEDDNDPVRFLAHFIAAWQTIDVRLGQVAQSLLENPNFPPLNHLMTMLINDLANLSESVVLVLDDYHLIRHPELRGAIAFFLDHLPPQCHLIIATREEPSLPLPRLRARWEVVEIRWQDLRFTREETAAFLKRTMGLALTNETVQMLEDHTEGWIAGLQMAALSLRGRAISEGAIQPVLEMQGFDVGHHDIIDYLAAEVLRQQPAEIRQFLHQTAILDRFNASLCNAVTERTDSQTILAELERANLFLIPQDDQRNWHRYHHLFADFLRAELTDSEQEALHARASRWHESQGLMPEAIRHALAARDHETAVRLIRCGAEDACRDGAYNTLLGWVNALPERVVRAHTDLLVHKGWILYLRGEILTGEAYAALAVENQRPDDLPLHRGMLLAFRAFLSLSRDNPAQAIRHAEEALTLLGGTESFYHTTVLSHLGQAQRLMGDRQTAIQTLRQAIALGQRLRHYLPTLEATGILALVLNQQGKLREAIQACEQAATQYLNSQGQPMLIAGLVYVPLGAMYYETNDLARAYHYLTTGIALCQQMGTVYYALVGQRTLARLYFAQGEIESMWETLAAARALAVNSGNQRRIRKISVVTAELQLRQGHLAAARRTLDDLPASAKSRSEQENLTSVRLLLAQKNLPAAQSLLQQIEQSARRHGRWNSLIGISVLQAVVYQAMNQWEAALDQLGQAISLAAPEGYRRVFLDEGEALAALLPRLRKLAPAFIAGLLEAHSSTSCKSVPPTLQVTPTASNTLIEPLSKTQLSILRLVADGLSNREIAARLTITEGTTKWHLNQIFGKLNVGSRTQAVAQARHLNLV
ncbi:MAG: helix-turn-helix transcriptional regulator [Acidobacteria bacterium]|nr:helix-turn-helix transcriptional regulator [Acidobacteriota bacterium]